jgi:GntR family transcriptional repressor for pyruvate dehydrogenase complex
VHVVEVRRALKAIAARDPAAARRHATEHLIRGEQRLAESGILRGPPQRKAAARTHPTTKETG